MKKIISSSSSIQAFPSSSSSSSPFPPSSSSNLHQSLVHYGVEVRHLPLAKHLPSAPKYISTKSWLLARDELKFSRCFDRVMELRQSASWGPTLHVSRPKMPLIPSTAWDRLLEEIWYLARDFEQHRRWKRTMAQLLAKEAQKCHLYRLKRRNFGHPGLFYPANDRSLIIEMRNGNIYGPGSGLKLDPISPLPLMVPQKSLPLNTQDPTAFETLESGESTSSQRLCNWNAAEDAHLLHLLKVLRPGSLKAIVDILNFTFHSGHKRHCDSQVCARIKALTTTLETRHRIPYHLERIPLMNSASTKLISPRPSVAPKKLNMVSHPSHEAAARKANQNISKLLTPQELAMRRIQRTRIITDPSGAIMV